MALRNSDVDEFVLTSLGGEDISVYLTPKDLEICRNDAMRRYSRVHPMRREMAFVVPPEPGLSRYPLSPGAYAVQDVQIQNALQTIESPVDSNGINLFNPLLTINTGYGGLGVPKAEDYELLLEWRQMTGREYSVEPDYWFDDDPQPNGNTGDVGTFSPKTMWIFNPSGLAVKASWVEVSPRPLDQIPYRDEDWVLNWSLAHGMEIFGRKLRHVKTVPMATQAIEFDGAELIEDAKEMKKDLLEDLHYRFIGDLTPIWG